MSGETRVAWCPVTTVTQTGFVYRELLNISVSLCFNVSVPLCVELRSELDTACLTRNCIRWDLDCREVNVLRIRMFRSEDRFLTVASQMI